MSDDTPKPPSPRSSRWPMSTSTATARPMPGSRSRWRRSTSTATGRPTSWCVTETVAIDVDGDGWPTWSRSPRRSRWTSTATVPPTRVTVTHATMVDVDGDGVARRGRGRGDRRERGPRAGRRLSFTCDGRTPPRGDHPVSERSGCGAGLVVARPSRLDLAGEVARPAEVVREVVVAVRGAHDERRPSEVASAGTGARSSADTRWNSWYRSTRSTTWANAIGNESPRASRSTSVRSHGSGSSASRVWPGAGRLLIRSDAARRGRTRRPHGSPSRHTDRGRRRRSPRRSHRSRRA